MFRNSSHFTINGGSFTNIERDQYIHVGPGGSFIQYVADKATQNFKNSVSWYRPFSISSANIRIQETLCDTAIGTSERVTVGAGNSKRLARCRVNIASIKGTNEGGESSNGEKEFLHIEYSGPGALRAYEEDLRQFSRNRTPHSVQLYGFSKHEEKLALLFLEAPIPVSYVLESHKYSPLLRTYIEYLYGASKTQTSSTPFSKLWISPRTGEVQTGPFVQVRVSRVDHLANGFESEALSPSGINNTPLPIATYNDPDALSHYLTENLSVQTILMGIRYSNRTYYEYDPEVEDLISTLSCLPGTIYRRSDRKIMLEIPPTIEGYKTQWTYGVWGERSTMPQNNEVISGQPVKFAFTLSEIQNLGRDSGLNHFELYYDIQPWREWADFVYAWLTQANYIFDQLGIQYDCKDHAYLNGFWLRFERQVMQRSKPLLRLKPADTPIYFFVRPVPRPSDEKRIWNTWVSRPKYFWSWDESGRTELPEETWPSLGLCSFASSIQIDHTWWDRNAYDEIRILCHSRGIETANFAVMLGYPTFQAFDRDDTVELYSVSHHSDHDDADDAEEVKQKTTSQSMNLVRFNGNNQLPQWVAAVSKWGAVGA